MSTTSFRGPIALAVGLWIGIGSWNAPAASNLVFNGTFDCTNPPLFGLTGWKNVYDLEGESWYADNYKYVAVVEEFEGHKNVLDLNGATQFIVDNPGVKVDSDPIPFQPGATYKFTVTAKSGAPQCRILLEGYRWKPGVKPFDKPQLKDLRKCYKFVQLYFGSQKGGDFGGIGSSWSTATMTFPDKKLTELQQDSFNKVQFVVVHMVAIGGLFGHLYIDDVTLEQLKPASGTGKGP